MKNAEHAEHNIFQTETVAVNEGEKGNLVMGIKTYMCHFQTRFALCIQIGAWLSRSTLNIKS